MCLARGKGGGRGAENCKIRLWTAPLLKSGQKWQCCWVVTQGTDPGVTERFCNLPRVWGAVEYGED